MTHEDAINAALSALGAALTQAHPDTDQAAAAGFVLQQLRADGTQSLGDLQDKQVSIASDVLIRLVTDAMKVPLLETEKAAAQKEADDLWNQWAAVKQFMLEDAPHSKKQSLALAKLGLIGNPSGKGGSRRNHLGIRRNYRAIADHYHLLRTGGHHFENGELIAVEPHSFNDAVVAIEARYGIKWDSLERECRRKTIKLEKKAEVYPVD